VPAPTPPLVQQRITATPNLLVVRDQIAAILLANLENQRALAEAEGADPAPYNVRVYVEREDCRGEFTSHDEEEPLAISSRNEAPLISVCFDKLDYDKRRSAPTERQQADAVYYLDIYACGVSEDTSSGWMPGDQKAANEVLRVYGLAYQILKSDVNINLGMVGVVGDVWINKFQTQALSSDDRDKPRVERIAVGRIEIEVSFLEYSPQYVAEPLELISGAVKRTETGQLYLTATIPTGV
jgi:hypothetical protein